MAGRGHIYAGKHFSQSALSLRRSRTKCVPSQLELLSRAPPREAQGRKEAQHAGATQGRWRWGRRERIGASEYCAKPLRMKECDEVWRAVHNGQWTTDNENSHHRKRQASGQTGGAVGSEIQGISFRQRLKSVAGNWRAVPEWSVPVLRCVADDVDVSQ